MHRILYVLVYYAFRLLLILCSVCHRDKGEPDAFARRVAKTPEKNTTPVLIRLKAIVSFFCRPVSFCFFSRVFACAVLALTDDMRRLATDDRGRHQPRIYALNSRDLVANACVRSFALCVRAIVRVRIVCLAGFLFEMAAAVARDAATTSDMKHDTCKHF